jgi:hypothetical protein
MTSKRPLHGVEHLLELGGVLCPAQPDGDPLTISGGVHAVRGQRRSAQTA